MPRDRADLTRRKDPSPESELGDVPVQRASLVLDTNVRTDPQRFAAARQPLAAGSAGERGVDVDTPPPAAIDGRRDMVPAVAEHYRALQRTEAHRTADLQRPGTTGDERSAVALDDAHPPSQGHRPRRQTVPGRNDQIAGATVDKPRARPHVAR